MTYDIELYKNDKLIRSTNMSVSEQTFTIKEAAAEARKLMLVAGYDQSYDSFSISLGEEKTFSDLIED